MPATVQYLWALRHGYRYRRITVASSAARHHSWSRLEPLRDALRSGSCEWIVYFSTRAWPIDARYSIDHYRARWGLHANASMLLASDPDLVGLELGPLWPYEHDMRGMVNLGFALVRATPTSIDTFDRLLACPDQVRRLACADHADALRSTVVPSMRRSSLAGLSTRSTSSSDLRATAISSTDLTARSLRPGIDIIDAPCDDANGWPYGPDPDWGCHDLCAPDGFFKTAWGCRGRIVANTFRCVTEGRAQADARQPGSRGPGLHRPSVGGDDAPLPPAQLRLVRQCDQGAPAIVEQALTRAALCGRH